MSGIPTPKDASIALRSAGVDDEQFLFTLYASTRQEEMASWGWNDQQQETFLRMQYAALQRRYQGEAETTTHHIVLQDGRPIGRLLVIRSTGEIRLADITLLPEQCGHGIGSALIADLQRESAAAGLPLRLHVVRDNRAARLYQRLGFVLIEDTGSHLKMEWLPPSSARNESQ